MSDLKPCPFCGGEAEIVRMGTGRVSMQIQCTDCGAWLETGETWIDDSSTWNTREQVSEITKQRDEYKIKLQEIAVEAESFCARTGKSVTWLNEVKELLEK